MSDLIFYLIVYISRTLQRHVTVYYEKLLVKSIYYVSESYSGYVDTGMGLVGMASPLVAFSPMLVLATGPAGIALGATGGAMCLLASKLTAASRNTKVSSYFYVSVYMRACR